MNTEIVVHQGADSQTIQLCSFWIANRLYGVNILDVKEISEVMDITPIHHSPKGVSGYMNVRGQIYLALDIRQLLGLPQKSIDEDSKVILFKPAVDEPFGIIVDKIDDVASISHQDVENLSAAFKEEIFTDTADDSNFGEILDFVCKMNKGLLVTLKPKGILNCIEKKI
jgi:purine-binding chemotaxis protein CheW